MRTVVVEEFGPPHVLVARSRRAPEPGPGQVAIAVERAGITFVETQLRAGRPPRTGMLPQLPVVLGNGVAGTICAVGEGVDADRVGETVVASLAGTGGYAERAIAAADDALLIPVHVSTASALAVLADGRTALLALDALALRPGETLLVAPAGGGVGTLLVQLATAAGVRVVAAAGAPQKREIARQLGAQEVLDYRSSCWGDAVAGQVDALVDGVGGEIGQRATRLLRAGGRRVALGMSSGDFAARLPFPDVEDVNLEPPSRKQRIALVRRSLDAVADGTLRPVIGAEHPLDRAADAHAAIEARSVVGKTLLVA